MSEILLSAKDLKPVMQGLGKVVSRKSTLPVLEHIRIARNNNLVTLQATDLDVWATHRYAEQQGDDALFHVPFETLNKIVRAIKGDAVITLHQDKESRLIYEVGNSPVEVKLNGLGQEEWPPEPQVQGEAMALPESFKPALREALECASADSSRYVLNGACLDASGQDGHYVIGTDGRHLFASNSFEFGIKSSLIIPSGRFIAWNGFAGDGAWTLVAAKVKAAPWLRITSDRWTLTSKQIDGNYPNWRQCRPVPDAKWTRIHFPATEVESLLRNIPLLPGHDDLNKPVTIQVTAAAVLLKGRARDAKEWTSLRLPEAPAAGKPVEVSLNREYLLKALRFGLTDLDLDDALSPLLFSSTGRQMVVMPLRGEAADRQIAARAEAEKVQPANPQSQPAPSAAPVTEERKTMPRETTEATKTTEPTPTKNALHQIDAIKDALKEAIRELTEVADALKQAEKEKKVTDREIDSIRAKLREIQSVKI